MTNGQRKRLAQLTERVTRANKELAVAEGEVRREYGKRKRMGERNRKAIADGQPKPFPNAKLGAQTKKLNAAKVARDVSQEKLKQAKSELKRYRDALPIFTIDKRGIDAIVESEGVYTKPYNDIAGHCTGGVGHLIHYGNCTAADFQRYKGWTTKRWMELLDRDLDVYEAAVVAAIPSKYLTQGRLNACVSLAYNIGIGGFQNSTVAAKLKRGDAKGAEAAFMMWNKAVVNGRLVEVEGLTLRRRREQKMFRS